MRRLQIQILAVIMLGLLASACRHEAETDRDDIITSNSQQTTQITEDGDTEIVLDETKWSMVWVSDFGLEKYPNQDYGINVEEYIRTVNIDTAVINGKLLTTRADAKCNGMWRENRKVIGTPAKTIEIYENGVVRFKAIPATFVRKVEWLTTQEGCGNIVVHHMEKFMWKNSQLATNIREGNNLKWLDEDGGVIAIFEKNESSEL